MTRVAKAQRRAGERLESDGEWEFGHPAETDGWPGPGVSAAASGVPWHVADEPGDADDSAEPEEVPRRASARPHGAGDHLLSLVHRVFQPAPAGAGARSVLVCAADGGRDATRTAEGVAEVLAAESERSVCLLDAGGQDGHGNGTHAAAEQTLAAPGSFNVTRRLAPGLWLAEPGAAIDAMAPDAARRRVAELRARFDYLVVDGRALRATTEAVALAPVVDGVILVVDEATTRRETARAVSDTLQAAGARLLGVVLANRTFPIPERVYRRL